MYKKLVIVFVHIITTLVIQIFFISYMVFYYDYSIYIVINSFVIGCIILGVDYVFSLVTVKNRDLLIKKPILLHGLDLILIFPPYFVSLYCLFPLNDGVFGKTSYSSYEMILSLGITIINAGLVIERILLIHHSMQMKTKYFYNQK